MSLYSGRGWGRPLLLLRDLLDVFEDRSKPFIRRPAKGQLATELRVPPAPGWRRVARHCSSFLFREVIPITRDASGKGQVASRQVKGGLPLQASQLPTPAVSSHRDTSRRSEVAASAGLDSKGSATASWSKKTDEGQEGAQSQKPRLECSHEPKTEPGSEQAS